MNRKIGDVIINPWVSKDYCGDLNPCYATVYIGNGVCIDYKGHKHRWLGLNAKKPEREYITVGHIDLSLKGKILAILAERKEE